MESKRSRFVVALIASVALTYVFGTFFVGCGKNDSQPAVVVPPPGPVVAGCTGCPAGMSLLASGLGRNISISGQVRMELGIEFFGTQNSNQMPPNSYQAVNNYQGQAGAQARLKVLFNDIQSSCNILPGEYTLTIQQPGMWSGQRVYNLNLISNSGPAPLQITISGGWVNSVVPAVTSTWGGTYPFVFQSTYVVINSQAPVAPGTMGNCGSFPFTFE